MMRSKFSFAQFTRWVSNVTGTSRAFVIAVLVILAWAITGPVFGFSDTWQLVINTATTIVTFLMVFLIQNTQNRDSTAVQLKLDELLRATDGAHNALMDLEESAQADLDVMRGDYQELARDARKGPRQRSRATGTPEVPTANRTRGRRTAALRRR